MLDNICKRKYNTSIRHLIEVFTGYNGLSFGLTEVI